MYSFVDHQDKKNDFDHFSPFLLQFFFPSSAAQWCSRIRKCGIINSEGVKRCQIYLFISILLQCPLAENHSHISGYKKWFYVQMMSPIEYVLHIEWKKKPSFQYPKKRLSQINTISKKRNTKATERNWVNECLCSHLVLMLGNPNFFCKTLAILHLYLRLVFIEFNKWIIQI